jgi:hypothetical protein
MTGTSGLKGRGVGRVLFLIPLAAMVLLLLTPAATARSPNTCVECHSDYYQYVDILQDDPETSFPDIISLGETAEVVAVVKNYCSTREYSELATVSANLVSLNGYNRVEGDARQTRKDVGRGTVQFTWTVTCLSEKADVLMITADALNDHEDTPLRDEYSILVNAPLSLSSTSVEVASGGTFLLDIRANRDISQLSLAPQGGLVDRVTVTPSSRSSISSGQVVTVTITSTGSGGASGEILLSWTDGDGGEDSFSLRTELFGEGKGGSGTGGTQRLMGRIIGWASTVLLVFSIVLGGYPGRFKRAMTRMLGNARRRVYIHCLVSFEIVLLTVLHAVILMLGHWEFLMWADSVLVADPSQSSGIYIDLGTAALGLMAVVGLQGYYQKQLCRVMGGRVWRYTHLIVSLAALALVLTHAFTVGSTFSPYFSDYLP